MKWLHIGIQCELCHYNITSWPRKICRECEKEIKQKAKAKRKAKKDAAKKE